MKKFKFSLQALLDVRLREEKGAKGELYQARLELAELEKRREQLQEEKKAYEARMRQGAKTGMKVEQIQAFYIYLEKLKGNLEAIKYQIAKAQKKCERLLQKLIEIRKMIKMLETLREQKYQEYIAENEKEDMKMMDDFINSKCR